MKNRMYETFSGTDHQTNVIYNYNSNGLFSVNESITALTGGRHYTVSKKLSFNAMSKYLERLSEVYDKSYVELRSKMYNSMFLTTAVNKYFCLSGNEGMYELRAPSLRYHNGVRDIEVYFMKNRFFIRETISDPCFKSPCIKDTEYPNHMADEIQEKLERLGVEFSMSPKTKFSEYTKGSDKLSSLSILKSF